MKISPLQLEHYFVSDLHFSASRGFDAEKPVELSDEQFVAEATTLPDTQDRTKWQIVLRVKHQPAATANTPYSFALEVVGFFHVVAEFPEDKVERLVKTNGATMLYGIAREVVRDFTSRGPHAGMMLPSVSFFEAPQKTQTRSVTTPETN